MKVVIFAGGLGTRLSEETNLIPKPMIEINGKPILWHIMKIYEKYNYTDFIILVGYKSYLIKEYFVNYFLHQSDVTVDLATNDVSYISNASEPWRVTLLDTGAKSQTGTRLLKAKKYIENEPFLLTYGDGLSDIDMNKQLEFHNSRNALVTMTAVQPAGRFGSFRADETTSQVLDFVEKPAGDGSWINGGFFICEPSILDHIPSDANVAFEDFPLQNIAKLGKLYSFHHHGFWKCMDTLRDKNELNELALSSPFWLNKVI